MSAAACGGNDDDDGGASASGTSDTTSSSGGDEGATLDPDAVVRIGWVGPADTVDPHKLRATATQPYVYLLYDRLTRIDPDTLEVEPMLAESWDFASDGTYIDFHLRQDVSFHDGNPVNAEAVKASLERGQTLEGSSVANLLSSITSIEVVDEYTVRLNVSEGGAQLPAILSQNAGAIISPAAIADGRDLGLDPGDAGSGPYLLTSISPPDSATFERAPGEHWDERASGAAGFEISYITDFNARLNGLRASQLDFVTASGIDQVQAVELGEQSGFDTRTVDTTTTFVFELRNNREPFSNADLRRAVDLAIDRDALANDFLQGFCTPTNQPYGPGHPLHDDSIKIEHDPEAAAELVSAMGGASLEMITVASTTFEPPAQVLQSQLTEAGIDVTIRPLPTSDLFSIWGSGEGDFLFVGILGYPHPYGLVADSYLRGLFDGGTVPDSELPAVEELAAQGVDISLDKDAQDEAFMTIFRDGTENNWIIPICTQKTTFVFSDRVVGVAEMDGQTNSIPDFRTLGITAD